LQELKPGLFLNTHPILGKESDQKIMVRQLNNNSNLGEIFSWLRYNKIYPSDLPGRIFICPSIQLEAVRLKNLYLIKIFKKKEIIHE